MFFKLVNMLVALLDQLMNFTNIDYDADSIHWPF